MKTTELKITGAEAVIQSLKAEGVKTIFGYPGGAIMPIYDALFDHLEEVTLLNISQLAKKAHASEASIVRMAKHLGYNGFFQMRLLLSNDVA